MSAPRVSIIIATYNKAYALWRVLDSIRRQDVPFEYEICVTDDGSTDDTKEVCEFYEAEYAYLDRPYPCGPAAAKNSAYKRARGQILLLQNDDVVHITPRCIELLCDLKDKRRYNVAQYVYGLEPDDTLTRHSQKIQRPDQVPMLYFAAIAKKHIYAIGGDDEDFTMLNYDDNWTIARLVKGRGLRLAFIEGVVGNHIWHPRPAQYWAGPAFQDAREIYNRKFLEAEKTGQWVSSSGPWEMTE